MATATAFVLARIGQPMGDLQEDVALVLVHPNEGGVEIWVPKDLAGAKGSTLAAISLSSNELFALGVELGKRWVGTVDHSRSRTSQLVEDSADLVGLTVTDFAQVDVLRTRSMSEPEVAEGLRNQTLLDTLAATERELL